MKKEYSCLFDKNVMNPYLGTTMVANWVHRIFLPKKRHKEKGALAKKKTGRFSNYFQKSEKIVGKSAFFHNWKFQLFLKIVGILKAQKTPIFQLFSHFSGNSWKIGPFLNTLNPKKARFSNYFSFKNKFSAWYCLSKIAKFKSCLRWFENSSSLRSFNDPFLCPPIVDALSLELG